MIKRKQNTILIPIIPLLLLCGLLTACTSRANNFAQATVLPANTILPTNTSLVTPGSASPNFQVITRPDPVDQSKTDIYLQNSFTNDRTFFITLDSVYSEHYHLGEFHNGNLYIIRRMGYRGENWSDELWRYDSQGNGEKLFSEKGLDFRVASNGALIAIAYQSAQDNANKIAFISTTGEVLQELTLDPTGNYLDQPGQWSEDNTQFWGELELGPTPKLIYQISISSWKIKKYDVSQLTIGDEFELNPNSGKIVYSDYPVFFAVDEKQQFLASGKEVKLFLYDLNTQNNQLIDTSITKAFSPKWLDNFTIEYDDPKGEKRIMETIK
jgi:hypothetical protein